MGRDPIVTGLTAMLGALMWIPTAIVVSKTNIDPVAGFLVCAPVAGIVVGGFDWLVQQKGWWL